jgi:hypothetical protein
VSDELNYRVDLELDNNVKLTQHLFNNKEHRWIFSHLYTLREDNERFGKVILTNELKLVVNYDLGVANDFYVTMNINRLDRKRKQFLAGMDISPNSHMYTDFKYEKREGFFQLVTIDSGRRGIINLNDNEEGLVKKFEFPFPVLDRVENDYGTYRYPFRSENEEIKHIFFQEKYSE